MQIKIKIQKWKLQKKLIVRKCCFINFERAERVLALEKKFLIKYLAFIGYLQRQYDTRGGAHCAPQFSS